MTTEPLFDALEICLQALDEGAAVESCLVRYPALADELRPILIAAVQARAGAVTEVPVDAARRGRARVLHAAAEMREQRIAAPMLPFWRKKGFFGARFYRLAVTTALVIAFLLTGGTGLVNASNGALPGDRLYPVKRSWEGLRLVLVFDEEAREDLEHKFKHERVQEIEELYSEKRFEQVNFEGLVETQQTGVWRISGLDVAVDDETVYTGEILPGATVQVIGETDDGIIEAERIILIAAPNTMPARPSMTLPVMTSEPQENSTEFRTPEPGDDSAENNLKETQSPEDSTEEIEPKETETKEKSDSEPENGETDPGDDGGSGEGGGDN